MPTSIDAMEVSSQAMTGFVQIGLSGRLTTTVQTQSLRTFLSTLADLSFLLLGIARFHRLARPSLPCHTSTRTAILAVGLALGLTILAISFPLLYLLRRARRQRRLIGAEVQHEKQRYQMSRQDPGWEQSVLRPPQEADSTPVVPEMDAG